MHTRVHLHFTAACIWEMRRVCANVCVCVCVCVWRAYLQLCVLCRKAWGLRGSLFSSRGIKVHLPVNRVCVCLCVCVCVCVCVSSIMQVNTSSCVKTRTHPDKRLTGKRRQIIARRDGRREDVKLTTRRAVSVGVTQSAAEVNSLKSDQWFKDEVVTKHTDKMCEDGDCW